MSVLDLLGEDGIEAKWVACTNGGEHASSCPGCGGADRFRVWPSQGNGGRWWCRQCGKSGDATRYLIEFRNMDFLEAQSCLGRRTFSRPTLRSSSKTGLRSNADWKPREISIPNALWMKKAGTLVSWAERRLWAGIHKEALDFLTTERKLHEETIRQARLGWNPKDIRVDPKRLGLPDNRDEKGEAKEVRIPEGWVIPCSHGERICRIRIRTRAGTPRYFNLRGSSSKTMVLDNRKDFFVVVENDLDALLLNQEAGDLISVAALGSAQIRPDAEASGALRRARLVLVSLDYDDAGVKETWTWWLKRFPNARPWPTTRGKDPTEASCDGLDLRQWILAGLKEDITRL